MRHRHTQLCSPIQLPALLKASRQTVDRLDASACPLCDWEPALRAQNHHIASEDIVVVTLDQFRRHLGSHMEQLALFALPRSQNDGDDYADSNKAAGNAGSSSQSRHSSKASSGNSNANVSDAEESDIEQYSSDTTGSLIPWTTAALSVPETYRMPFPFWLAAVSQKSTPDGQIYIHGGAYQDKQSQDFWTFERKTGLLSPVTASMPAPMLQYRHAAILASNILVVYGRHISGDADLGNNELWIFSIGEEFISLL